MVVVLFVTITEEEQCEEAHAGKLINRDDREEAARNRVDVLSNPRAAARRIKKSILFYVARKLELFTRVKIRFFGGGGFATF
jgi:hypothetical protein